jgi:hypothetical protein
VSDSTIKKFRKPTIAQLLAKYPEMLENNNCITDIACPKCGYRVTFTINYTTAGVFSDDGEEEQVGDQEWQNDNVRCHGCDHTGTLKQFTFAGLDDALAKRRQDTR